MTLKKAKITAGSKKCAFCERGDDVDIFENYLVQTDRKKSKYHHKEFGSEVKIPLCQDCINEKIKLEKDLKGWREQLMQICKKNGSVNQFTKRKFAIREAIYKKCGFATPRGKAEAPTPKYTKDWVGPRPK